MATNANPAIAGRGNGLVDRINALDSRANTPMLCPDCGGSFFFKVTAEQFSDSGYGSAQFRSLTMTPEAAYLCLCGYLVPIKETSAKGVFGTHPQFLKAIKAATEFQDERSGKALKIAEAAATVAELDEVKLQLKDLEDLIDALKHNVEVLSDLAKQSGAVVVEAVPVVEPVEEPAEEQVTEQIPELVPATEAVSNVAPAPQFAKISQPVRTGRRKAVA